MDECRLPARRLSASQVLTAWERGEGQPVGEQALALLVTAYPEVPVDRLARLSIGERNTCLLGLREETFGSRLEGLATCPACGERVELSLDAAKLREGAPAALTVRSGEGTHTVNVAGYDVTFRLPEVGDLEALRTDDVEVGRQWLLRRCVLSACRDGKAEPLEDLPAEVLAGVAERMDAVDPQANVELILACPSCDHEWQALFDIAPFLCGEIRAWAHRLLRDVHTLASAYGWREADILAMSRWRRDAYLDMVRE